jgi:thymidylate kinase
VRAREVLELRVLARLGNVLPSSDPVLAVAAGVEAGLGGEELSRWQQGPALPTPSPLPGSKARARSRRLRSALKPRVVVAVSGVDGAGKSTLARVLIEQLDRVAVPCAPVWTRPGMRIGWLEGVARRAKRILGEDPAPGVQTVARGERNPSLASRRGLVGMVWALLVTLSFSIDVRCRHLQTRGVVVYDRHLLDALVTLDFVYEGVDLRFHRRLLRAAIPGASVSFYVEVPAEVAIRRKRDELFGEHAVRRQLDLYERRRREIRDLHTLDGTRPPGDLAHAVLKVLLDEQ